MTNFDETLDEHLEQGSKSALISLKNNKTAGNIAKGAALTLGIIYLLITVFQFICFSTISSESSGYSSSDEIYFFIAAILSSLGTIILLLFIILGVIWFYHSYNNLARSRIQISFASHQAAWSQFIPFFNLVRPFQIARDLVSRTKSIINQSSNITYVHSNNEVVNAIWVVIILTFISKLFHLGYNIYLFYSENHFEMETELSIMMWNSIILNILSAILMFLAFVFINHMMKDEKTIATLANENQ